MFHEGQAARELGNGQRKGLRGQGSTEEALPPRQCEMHGVEHRCPVTCSLRGATCSSVVKDNITPLRHVVAVVANMSPVGEGCDTGKAPAAGRT